MNNTAIALDSVTRSAAERGLAAEIASLAPWAQNITLPDGSQTAPDQEQARKAARTWEAFRDFLPADLAGRTALDIGCNAGFYALELARRGAHVTAVETSPHFLRQARWVIGRHNLGGPIDLLHGHAYDLARWRGRHDVVLLLGQLHRLRYPMLALDIAAQLAQRCLVLQVDLAPEAKEAPSPAAPESPATWWTPARATIEAMVRAADFEVVAQPGAGIFVCQPQKHRLASPRWNEAEFTAATGTAPAGLGRVADDTRVPRAAVAPLSLLES